MTPGDPERYSRQAKLPGIGVAGQLRLGQAHAAIVGCGALGTVHAMALGRAGVGHLTLIDRDTVELSNLQRQWLYEESDAAGEQPKALAAARAVRRANSAIDVQAEVADVTAANVEELLAGADVVLDGCDNFETRYLINDFCVREGIPWVYGAAVGTYGVCLPILPGETPCLRCLYPEPPSGVQPTCETAGVLGTVTTVIASLQVTEALKILSGNRAAVQRAITRVDLWNGLMRQSPLPERDPECPVCVRREFAALDGKLRTPISLCGRNAVQIHERSRPLDLDLLARQLAPLGPVRMNECALRFFTPPYELTVFPDGRAIIKGTQEIAMARSLYARYVGN